MTNCVKKTLLPWLDKWVLGSIAEPDVTSEAQIGEAEDADKMLATDALIEAKKEMLSGFRSVGLQGGAFLGIIFGWTLTDDNAQRFLDEATLHRVGAAMAVIFIGVALHLVLRSYRVRSQQVSHRLKKIGKVSSVTVDCYSIERRHILTTLGLFLVLCVVLSYDIYQVQPSQGRENINVWIQHPPENTQTQSGAPNS